MFEGNEDVNFKLFHPVPVHVIKHHSLDIDGEVLYYLLKDANIGLPTRTKNNKSMIATSFEVNDTMNSTFANTSLSRNLRVREKASLTRMAYQPIM